MNVERERNGFRKCGLLWNGMYWVTALLYWEILLHGAVFETFRLTFGYCLGFTAAAALVIAVLLSLLPGKVRFWGNLLAALLLMVLYGSQMVYQFIFGTLYSVAAMGQGGQAVTAFWRETLSAMAENWLWLAALAVPVVLLICVRKQTETGLSWKHRMFALLLAALLTLGMEQLLLLNGTGTFSDYDYYHSATVATNPMAERFGLLTTFRLELLGSRNAREEAAEYYIAQEEPAETALEYNTLDFDFEQLNAMTEDERLLAINAYCAQLPGTSKNDYTGMLADYNLILICGESFSRAAIHPEATPTLYKLASEGFLFRNYYNSFPNTTTDGEYALLQGLWPDYNRGKNLSSLYASRGSYLPFTLGNAFSEQLGIQSWGYHNYWGSYYGREASHPNMGYTMQFARDGMEFTTRWPASDLEMLEQSVDDYIGQEQFHAYYMTFSGHYRYETSTNAIAARNWERVKDMPYSSDVCKAYLSCNIELDKALEYLLRRLEEQGVADRTAIVLAGDHYPYGLSDVQYEELTGEKTDAFSKFHDSLIFWVGGLEENIVVEEYCCNVDILPTILNLWGLEYDSRMLAGTDVFSDGEHMAVLADRSWLTDEVWFHADTGEIRYLVEESQVPAEEIENRNRLIETRFSVSSEILNTAYYNFVFGKEMVKVTDRGWNKG